MTAPDVASRLAEQADTLPCPTCGHDAPLLSFWVFEDSIRCVDCAKRLEDRVRFYRIRLAEGIRL